MPHLIDKDMVRDSVSNIEIPAAPSGLVSEMVKVAGEPEIDMIKDIVNQVILS